MKQGASESPRRGFDWSSIPVPRYWTPLRDGRDAAFRVFVLAVMLGFGIGIVVVLRELIVMLPLVDRPYALGAAVGFFVGWMVAPGKHRFG